MNVLHLDTGREWRGGQQQVFSLSAGLRERGITSVVLTPKRSPLAERLQAAGLPCVEISWVGPYSPRTLLVLRKFLAEYSWDVLHAHTAHAHTALYLLAKVVGFSDGNAPARVVSRRVDFVPSRDPITRLKYGDPRQHFIGVSEGVGRVLERYGIPRERISIVHSGVEVPPAPFSSEHRIAAREQLGVDNEVLLVGTIGQLVPHKGHTHLIDAFAQILPRFPSARLVVLGEGQLDRSLHEQAQRLGIDSAILFPGYVPHAKSLLPAFDLYVSSSVEEGLGTSILDAQATGLPVVATSAGGSAETVQDGVTGLLVPPADPSQLAVAMLSLLTDPSRRASLGSAGPAWIRQHFSTEAMIEGTVRVYGTVGPGR